MWLTRFPQSLLPAQEVDRVPKPTSPQEPLEVRDPLGLSCVWDLVDVVRLSRAAEVSDTVDVWIFDYVGCFGQDECY